ncbi:MULTISPECIES: cell wall hydrolase [unclassified Beijerinckia]|uniref:cell wall hydrolase n=1 Tax=unclassified Beijerinckia TaxID=2638183 RepID=UPI00089C9FC0|nr:MULTISPECIES: cell wall hydrolase [unclassified Beijerinckia]MDH7797149.1 spore germination cell wall hydrolase CwlJ-like protein [Beijerinckia sp. GAS462]SEC74141.1 Cell wall hydrolase CwlJ, involved in spore germination [Beijerinckia sp. 28-YEA-48]
MGRSRFGWALGAFAPWCLGLVLAVTVAADAGQDASIGSSLAPMTPFQRANAGDLILPSGSSLRTSIALPRIYAASLVREASLTVGEKEDLIATDEIEPRKALKTNVTQFPTPNRSHKGDPVVGLRPSFDAKLRKPGDAANFAARTQITGDSYLAFDGLEQPEDGLGVGTVLAAPLGSNSPQNRDHGPDGTSPTHSVMRTLLQPDATPLHLDGSTPAVRRAVALSSTTPVPTGAQVEVVYVPIGGPVAVAEKGGVSVIARNERPDYAAIIEQARSEKEQRCLAEAVYFEARSEPEEGQAAVAQVVLNRAVSGLYPASVCGVVFQNRHRYKACQFSFACEGKSLHVTEPESWATAQRIAEEVLDGKTWLADVGGATHYHANYVRPGWSKRLLRMDRIGAHIFYKLKPGQT